MFWWTIVSVLTVSVRSCSLVSFRSGAFGWCPRMHSKCHCSLCEGDRPALQIDRSRLTVSWKPGHLWGESQPRLEGLLNKLDKPIGFFEEFWGGSQQRRYLDVAALEYRLP